MCGGRNKLSVYSTAVDSPDDRTEIETAAAELSPASWLDLGEDQDYVARHECSFVQAGDRFFMFGGREQAQIDLGDRCLCNKQLPQ